MSRYLESPLRFVPVIFWMGFIFFLSSRSVLVQFDRPMAAILFFKTAHVVTYALLALFWWLAIAVDQSVRWRVLAIVFFMTTLYGISDEIHQLYVPGRMGRFADVLFDASGALAMILILRLVKHKSYRGVSSNDESRT